MSAQRLVVGIAGGTGSGKTTVAHKLAAAMPPGRCVTIEHDAYYRDQAHLSLEERTKINYDHPASKVEGSGQFLQIGSANGTPIFIELVQPDSNFPAFVHCPRLAEL